MTKLSKKELKAIAVMYGNSVGDALGAHTEFEHFDMNRKVMT